MAEMLERITGKNARNESFSVGEQMPKELKIGEVSWGLSMSERNMRR